MEIASIVFALLIVSAGLLLIARVRDAVGGAPPPDPSRERQLIAYEERRMRLRRDRVWSRVESMHSEFSERHSSLPLRDAPRPARVVGKSEGFSHGDLQIAFEQFADAHARPAPARPASHDTTPAEALPEARK